MPQLQSTVAAPVVDTMEKKSRKNLKSEETEDSQERNCSALKKSLRKKEYFFSFLLSFSMKMHTILQFLPANNYSGNDIESTLRFLITFFLAFFRKKINNCGHHDKEHYAKGMCSNCYHKYGRTKKPWLCPHSKLYACGLC